MLGAVGCLAGEAAGELLGFVFALGLGFGLGCGSLDGGSGVKDGLLEGEERLNGTHGGDGTNVIGCGERARPARGRALGGSGGFEVSGKPAAVALAGIFA